MTTRHRTPITYRLYAMRMQERNVVPFYRPTAQCKQKGHNDDPPPPIVRLPTHRDRAVTPSAL